MSDWPKQTQFVGKPTPRIDGVAKVTGAAKYGSDVQPPGWLYGMIYRSKWPAARIKSVNLDKAKAIPGIKAAVLVREGERQVRYYGEEIAAVAGTSKQACLDALRAIDVEVDEQMFVVKELDAIKPDAPKVFDNNPNLGAANERKNGDVDDAFAKAAAVAELTLETQVQIHNPLETHGNTVSVENDEITVWASTQGIFSVRDGTRAISMSRRTRCG